MSRLRTFFMTAAIGLAVVFPAFAQNGGPVPAPADVVLRFSTRGDQRNFHVGELIPVQFSYSAASRGEYLLVAQSTKLTGGRALEVSCLPSAEQVRPWPRLEPERTTFEEMLIAPCGGVGAAGGGGCSDCGGEMQLGTEPINFTASLNSYVRFRSPGTYTCTASSADITTALRDEKIRTALLVGSNPLVLNIIDDPEWAHSAAIGYADAYEKLCRGDHLEDGELSQCGDISSRLIYLDTVDSLAAEVRFFDGRSHSWDNQFWQAIMRSSHPNEALHLLTNRVQDPDVELSTMLIAWLAGQDLRLESPEAFETAEPAIHHVQAVEKLRKYVRLLGGSLSKKNSNVLLESAMAYRTLALQEYCEGKPLITNEERNAVLAKSAIR